ncbi:uncharacterized protein Z520_03845 [Fonsecaea multimorphosa CBS 102226]|uniref:D-isomer specific 2-hydroxyacid dehydrogenase NAD-binding domain-containing protein n=1 Tax=Fonsecaea multimorphosa CBS 102226 TaxID=1442371 RepID=A0A0D2KAF5_9EURO|nr:uncharacterized protein Z520_03845 [Fonsecaea multimorphosa CBS 102226]KIY00160.1 hypothetical protein Z520_03845 [Fonsecaea multimorphosa CBS 102226]OAL27354.1 hypothetical protein AYO22_03629 [Fonsecaea multimorphosa]
MPSTHSNGIITHGDSSARDAATGQKRKPIVLFVNSSVREIDAERWKDIQSRFDILDYDCSTVDEFIACLKTPGHPYTRIDALVWTGWFKAGPFAPQTELLLRGEPLELMPPSLKLVCCSGHGYDHADVARMTERGILYCNTPEACTEATANVALMLILNTFRYLSFAERCARTLEDGGWNKSRTLGSLAIDPEGQVLGIVGMGSIGRATARKAATALGMEIHYYNRRQLSERDETLAPGCRATYHASLDSLVSAADCLCLACGCTPDMVHMLSTPQFNLAKPTGLRIVNVGRGALIDETALLSAIEAGKVIGVGLDVHADEPNINPALRENYMVTVLPHIGTCSRTSWTNIEKRQLDDLDEFFFGSGKPRNAVNKQVYG